MKLTDKPVTNFLDELASNAPAPGGGSVASLSGALGAALVSMVCNLTLGKKKYAAVQDDIAALVAQSEALRHRLASRDDAAVFDHDQPVVDQPQGGGRKGRIAGEIEQAGADRDACHSGRDSGRSAGCRDEYSGLAAA